MISLLQALQALPASWGLVAVDGKKRAYQPGWQRQPRNQEQLTAEIQAGRALAIGVVAGPASGGLLFVDHDGPSATAELDRLAIRLPPTWTVTSGLDGRYQAIFTVPEAYWSAMRTRRVFKTGKLDADGKAEQLDLRWSGHYSIVAGAHPQTTGYRWKANRAPTDLPLAAAPTELIELLLPEPELPPLLAKPTSVPLLDFVTRDSRDLITTGGTPGSWNDDQLRLALDLKGTEAWLSAEGIIPDLSARDAFELHINAARSKAKDFDTRKAWHRFDGAERHNPSPGTPEAKLRERLAYHSRTPREVQVVAPDATPQATAVPIKTKPQKLEAGELLDHLRNRADAWKLRWNVLTQTIELDTKPFPNAERFYLQLSEQGIKVSKELAIDCLVQVAQERMHDPVREYLEKVEQECEPAYIDGLATAYLRPEDAAPGAPPTLYDHMLRCTLIAAVKRAFEPGCKHDTACVLMGEQGGRKSSFWRELGGLWFSDSLGNCDDKDDLLILHRSWICEWPELDRVTNSRHAGQIKSFLSRSTDHYRVPYGKAAEAFDRRGIIVGSTNRDAGFLSDDTGNRRFWIIPVTRTETNPIDTGSLGADRDGIWAAAVKAYRAGALTYLPPELAAANNRNNRDFELQHAWTTPILDWIAAPKNQGVTLTTDLLLTQAVGKPIERQTKFDLMTVGSILREAGYRRRQALIDGARRWVFER